uniref:hypothetical protein n=1 Tax=Enterobacter sp. TaxID=42895 RepID=UPI00296EC5C7
MVTSCTGQRIETSRKARCGNSSTASDFLAVKFSSSPTILVYTDAADDIGGRFVASFCQASHGLQGSQTSDVRAHNRVDSDACDVNQQLKVRSMGRQKAVIKARREAKRV